MKSSGGSKPPLALSKIRLARYPGYMHRARVGKYIAVANSAGAFDEFADTVCEIATSVLHTPPRLMPLAHLINATVQRMSSFSVATNVLVEGVLYELVSRGSFKRFTTLSRERNRYNVILSPQTTMTVGRAVEVVRQRLITAGHVSVEEARSSIDDVSARPDAGELLLGHFLVRGIAAERGQPGEPIVGIHIPR